MVTEDDRTIHDPFGRFRVTTEPIGDGRQIHYYEWPAEPSGAGQASGPDEPPDERDE